MLSEPKGPGRPPPRSSNLIQTGVGTDYSHHIITPPSPLDFQTFLRSCSTLLLLGDRSKFAVKTRYPINYPLLLGSKMFPGYFSKTGDKMRINKQMKILSKHIIFWIRTCKIFLWVNKGQLISKAIFQSFHCNRETNKNTFVFLPIAWKNPYKGVETKDEISKRLI